MVLPGRSRIAWYVTGHGFGHATRTAAIIEQLLEAAETAGLELELELSTTVPPYVFRELLARGHRPTFRPFAPDVGLLQQHGLSIDFPRTVEALEAHLAGFDALADREAAHLAATGCELVVADIPALPFRAARIAGIPCVASGNFDWTFIYEGYLDRDPIFRRASERFAEEYSSATLLLKHPFSPSMALFPRQVELPVVSRRVRSTPEEVRRRLGLDDLDRRPLVLISFGGLGAGGFGLPGFDEASVAAEEDLVFVAFGEPSATTPPHVLRVRDDALHVPDLVAAADVVVTKLGYGIVSEACARDTGLLYTPRPDFPEFPVMKQALPGRARAEEIAPADLCSGRFRPALDRLLPRPGRAPRCRVDGARVAAEVLVQLLEGRGPEGTRLEVTDR